MKKEKYERTELEIIRFLTEDVIMTSTEPEEDDFVTVPEGVTLEQLIEESKQYVDAILVTESQKRNDSPTVFLKTGDSDEVPDTELSTPVPDTEGSTDDQAEADAEDPNAAAVDDHESADDKDAESEDTEEDQNTDK